MRNQRHNAARAVTAAAIRAGFLVRMPCEVCGLTETDAHHDDYAKPLDVRWLCRSHHVEQHRQHGFAERGPGRPPRAERTSAKRFELRLTEQERARWQAAANRRDQTLAEFVRACVEAAI